MGRRGIERQVEGAWRQAVGAPVPPVVDSARNLVGEQPALPAFGEVKLAHEPGVLTARQDEDLIAASPVLADSSISRVASQDVLRNHGDRVHGRSKREAVRKSIRAVGTLAPDAKEKMRRRTAGELRREELDAENQAFAERTDNGQDQVGKIDDQALADNAHPGNLVYVTDGDVKIGVTDIAPVADLVEVWSLWVEQQEDAKADGRVQLPTMQSREAEEYLPR